MKKIIIPLAGVIIAMFFLFAKLPAGIDAASNLPDITFAASTPGHSLIKSMLSIPEDAKIDFMRWDLLLKKNGGASGSFLLNISYGESKPNTLGFKEEQELALKGEYVVIHKRNNEIYHLKNDNPAVSIMLVKINENLFHILTPDSNLMAGNGGWSYTLNRNEPLENIPASAYRLADPSAFLNDTSRQLIFEGRSPCMDFAEQYNLDVYSPCIKLKWGLILYKDPLTLEPTTYRLRRVQRRPNDLEGKWTIRKGFGGDSNAIVYQLDPDKPEKSISFLAGDENVLFFIDKDTHLYVGDSNFSYTLNRRTTPFTAFK